MEEQDLIQGIIADLKRDMKDGFDAVRSDVREMVTKGEFKAEVGRLDANHANLKEEFKANKVNTRWVLGFAVTIVGIAVAIINTIWP